MLAPIPSRAERSDPNRTALKEAADQMDAFLKREGFSEAELDEVTQDFRV